MTNVEAFQFGFLLKCAEDGLPPAQVVERIEKLAALKDWIPSTKTLWDQGKNLAQLGVVGAAAPALAGALGGGALGYGLARAQDEPLTAEEARKEELIAEYKRAIQEITRRRQMVAAA